VLEIFLSCRVNGLLSHQRKKRVTGAAWFLEHKYPNNWASLEKRAVESFIPDTNRDVIKERIEKYWAERKRRNLEVVAYPTAFKGNFASFATRS